MTEAPKYVAQRKKLVQLIKQKGITDKKTLHAIETVPRQLFMDKDFSGLSYEDNAFQIGEGQTISQPYTVAMQTMLLDVRKSDKVLEIGTGSGYQAAVLCTLGAIVYTIERNKVLFDKARKLFENLNYKIQTFYGDGYNGLPAFAPFDRIIVTAAAPALPEQLLKQLRAPGILVIPVGTGHTQRMMKVTKAINDTITSQDYGSYSFVPMIKAVN